MVQLCKSAQHIKVLPMAASYPARPPLEDHRQQSVSKMDQDSVNNLLMASQRNKDRCCSQRREKRKQWAACTRSMFQLKQRSVKYRCYPLYLAIFTCFSPSPELSSAQSLLSAWQADNNDQKESINMWKSHQNTRDEVSGDVSVEKLWDSGVQMKDECNHMRLTTSHLTGKPESPPGYSWFHCAWMWCL